MRGSIIQNNALALLPLEKLYNRIPDVWNLSSEQGNLGTLYLTNVRIVWHANLAQNFNVSVPYLQIVRGMIRESKFGRAMVLETQAKCGGYILGFRIFPDNKLQEVFKEVNALHSVFAVNPIFGVEFDAEKPEGNKSVGPDGGGDENEHENVVKSFLEEGDNVIEEDEDDMDGGMGDSFAAYYAEGGSKNKKSKKVLENGGNNDISEDSDDFDDDAEIEYNTDIGLACEVLREGFTLEGLWGGGGSKDE